MTYTIHGSDKHQIMQMRYRVENDTIVTDQPSAPRAERTAFSISAAGELTLRFGGTPYRFRRADA